MFLFYATRTNCSPVAEVGSAATSDAAVGSINLNSMDQGLLRPHNTAPLLPITNDY